MSLDHIPLLPGAHRRLGHAPEFRDARFSLLERMQAQSSPVLRLRFPAREVVLLNSPRAVYEVLVAKARSFEKSPLARAALYPLAGEGLFTSEGALWRRQRRLMAPLFHRAQIDAFAPLITQCAERTCARWRDGDVLDVAAETTHIAMAVAGRTLFGIDTSDDTNRIGDALTIALDWASRGSSRSLALALQVELRLALLRDSQGSRLFQRARARLAAELEAPILWPTRRNRELARAIALLDAQVRRMIDQRRASEDRAPDLLTHLLQAQDEDDGTTMTDKQVRDEILTLFVAGHETTANGLAWAIYLLARDRELYARARAAVDALGGARPTLADIPRLGFLDRVFREALRLYPPVYLFARMASEDVVIDGHPLPARSIVLLSPYSIQRRADLWPEPARFDPDRFSPELEAARPRGAWFPFGDGPRICIGAYFALLEAPLVLATLLQRADFELTRDAEILPETTATLRPAGGIPVRLKLREPPVQRAAVSLTT